VVISEVHMFSQRSNISGTEWPMPVRDICRSLLRQRRALLRKRRSLLYIYSHGTSKTAERQMPVRRSSLSAEIQDSFAET